MRNQGSLIFGLILIILGSLFLLDNLGFVDSEYVFENFWPLVLVLIGLTMLLRKTRGSAATQNVSDQAKEVTAGMKPSVESGSDFLVQSALFGDVYVKVTSKNFSGGSCSVIFGKIDLDLTQTEFKQGHSTLRLSGVFGGIDVEVSPQIEVAVNATLVAGEIRLRDQRRGGLFESLVYKSPGFDSAERKLLIQASQMFGEIKVRH